MSLFIQSNEAYLGYFKLVSDKLSIPLRVYPAIFYFLLIEILLHLSFTFFVWVMALFSASIFHLNHKRTEKLSLGIWLLGILCILLANQFYFPNSKFAELMSVIVPHSWSFYLFSISLFMLTIISAFALWGFILKAPRLMLSLVCLLIMTICVFGYTTQHAIKDGATKERPNIVFIGIDSLRPDFLGFYGHEKKTSNLDAFLNRSAVFSNALTPIARTFPSWVSILTGQYPKHHGIRFNLALLNQFDRKDSLPFILRENGYETIFATDETRFSNIDQQFGFDKVITPPIGFNDFLIGSLNDFPLSNLLVNTPLGKLLFPYNYANRAALATYHPATFLNFVENALPYKRTKPIFLAVHFCLPHYPYLWGSQTTQDRPIQNYQAAITGVDQQFGEFINLLQRNHLLDHSIVVVFSDHGEAMALPGDRITEADLFKRNSKNKRIPHFYPAQKSSEKLNQSIGHGTDILSFSQYHSLLAFQFFGLNRNKVQIFPPKVSLLDIHPSILDFLKIKTSATDGVSLTSLILGKKNQIKETDFFMETDFSPQSIHSVHPETRKLLFEGINFFRVDPFSTRLTVKQDMGKLIISSKQYADVYQNWILALYPRTHKKMQPILVNLVTGEWTDRLNLPFAKKAPVEHMLNKLKDFYKEDINI